MAVDAAAAGPVCYSSTSLSDYELAMAKGMSNCDEISESFILLFFVSFSLLFFGSYIFLMSLLLLPHFTLLLI